MKRKTAALALCGLMVFALAGCGGENGTDTGAAKTSEDVEYDVNDYVTLGDYQNLEVQITGDYTVDQSDVDAMVDNLFDTHHAVSLVTSTGAELLLHVGIDTVKLGGRHFTAHVQNGQKVKKGDLLISFDREAIQAEGYLCTTPLIVCNTDDYSAVKPLASGSVQPGQDLLQLDGGTQT